ncbi:MAG: DNA-processing protein DprA [Rhodospirillales bacterium]
MAAPQNRPEKRPLNAGERCAWLRLIRTEHVGPMTFRRLLGRFGSAEAALAALPGLARRGSGSKAPKIYPPEKAEAEIEALEALGAALIARCEPGYPPLLAAIEDAPPLISVLGDPTLLERPAGTTIAVVGARNASLNGRRLARDIAAGLGRAGQLVVSGMARGIDAAAHEGALATGTVGVLAGGVDHVYPKENAALFAEVRETGALISEMPPGTVPQAQHFPRRNRLISGMAQGVVVIEAGQRSGSLITARMALEQGRDVFAVPGSPLDPRNRGSNDLLRQGAILTESADDVLGALGPLDPALREAKQDTDIIDDFAAMPEPGEAERAQAAVLECLGPAPVKVDEIIRSCHLSAPAVSAVLLELELAGRLERHPGQQVSLIRALK